MHQTTTIQHVNCTLVVLLVALDFEHNQMPHYLVAIWLKPLTGWLLIAQYWNFSCKKEKHKRLVLICYRARGENKYVITKLSEMLREMHETHQKSNWHAL